MTEGKKLGSTEAQGHDARVSEHGAEDDSLLKDPPSWKKTYVFKTKTPETAQLPKFTIRSSHHKGKVKTCAKCEAVFTGTYSIAKHLCHLYDVHQVELSAEDKTNHLFSCIYEDCNSYFPTEPSMFKHERKVHKTYNKEPVMTTPKRYPCEYCGVVKTDKGCLVRHIKVHHTERDARVNCPVCNASYHKEDIKIHMYVHKRALQLCPHCDFQTTNNPKYKFHLYTKHGDSSAGVPIVHKCDKCDYVTDRKNRFQQHLHFVHGVQIEGFSSSYLQCAQCHKVFTDKIPYWTHIRSHKEKTIKCQYCDFMTTIQSKLRKHIGLKHSLGRFNKPWTCTMCSFASNIKWSLKAHFMNTHKMTKEEADRLTEEVKIKYMELNNGEEPKFCPKVD